MCVCVCGGGGLLLDNHYFEWELGVWGVSLLSDNHYFVSGVCGGGVRGVSIVIGQPLLLCPSVREGSYCC